MTHGLFLFLRWLLAWITGAVVYFFAVIITVYDGLLSLIFQPFCAAFISALCVAACAVVGLPLLSLRRYRAFRLWGALAAGVLALLGVCLLLYSASAGQRIAYADPVTEEQFDQLGGTALPGYLALLFALANWPAPFAPASPPIRHA
jgi:hypothetical protein